MPITLRYLCKEFLKIFTLAVLGLICIYLIADFVEKIDRFFQSDLPISTIFIFFISQLPQIIYLTIPVAALISTLICLGILAKNSEIVAFKASGISLWYLSYPFIFIGLTISISMFFLSNLVIPHTSKVANSIWNVKVRTGSDENPPLNNVWLKTQSGIQFFKIYHTKDLSFKEAEFFFLNENFKLTRRIIAENGFWQEGKLNLYKVSDKQYKDDILQAKNSPVPLEIRNILKGGFFVENSNELILNNWPKPPKDIGLSLESTEQMSTRQLKVLIKQLSSDGFDPIKQEVDYHFKFSYPFISLIMMVIGLPLAFWKEKGGGIAFGIAIGLVLSFIYLIFLGLARSFGYSSILPPILAAWLPNVFFLIFGFYLFTHVRQ